MEPTTFLPALPTPQLPTICNPEYFKPTYESLIESFLSGRNERTIEAYRDDLKAFCAFLRLNTEVRTLDDAAKILLTHGHGWANGLALKYKTYMLDKANFVIHPQVGGLHWTEFALAKDLVREGEKAAREKLRLLRKTLPLSIRWALLSSL